MAPVLDDLDTDGPIAASTSAAAQEGGSHESYMYTQELSQMMFVFAHVVDPSKAVLHLLEDIVRHQVVQMIIQARNLSVIRRSRHLHTEDLIFLVRYDRAKVNRLRTYLSWKDVRKNAKDDGGGGGAGEVDLNAAVEDADTAKAHGGLSRKLKVKLPWEVSTIYADYIVPGAGAHAEQARSGLGGVVSELPPELEAAAAKVQQPTVDEELDEDDHEAMKESLKRLKEADEATLKMTREEYEHYSDCRTASFTFRKGKKFRDFLSASNYLDAKPNDDIVDILGFLAYEVVREITIGAKQVWEQERAIMKRSERREPKLKKIKKETSQRSTVKHLPASDPEQAKLNTFLSTIPSEAKCSSMEANTVGSPSTSHLPTTTESPTKIGGEIDVQKLYAIKQEGDWKDDETSSHHPPSFCGLFGLADSKGDVEASHSTKTAGKISTDTPSLKRSVPDDADAAVNAKRESDQAGSVDDGHTMEEEEEEEEEKDASPDLLVHHIRESMARMERHKTRPALSAGVRVGGPAGGLRRTNVFVL